jgi:hypothetical protein
MHGQDFLDRFQLNDDFVVDNQVDSISAIQPHALVANRHVYLLAKRDVAQCQLATKADLIYRLQETWAKRLMNVYRGCYDFAGQRLLCVV